MVLTGFVFLLLAKISLIYSGGWWDPEGLGSPLLYILPSFLIATFLLFLYGKKCRQLNLTNEAFRTISSKLQAEAQLSDKLRKELLLHQSTMKAMFLQDFQFLALLDHNGAIVEMNKATLTFFDYTEKQVLRRDLLELDVWELNPELKSLFRKYLREVRAGELVRFEATIKNKQGIELAIAFTLRPVTDNSGVVAFVILQARNITEILATQNNLSASYRELRLINEVMRKSLDEGDPKQVYEDALHAYHSLAPLAGVCLYDLTDQGHGSVFRELKFGGVESIQSGSPDDLLKCEPIARNIEEVIRTKGRIQVIERQVINQILTCTMGDANQEFLAELKMASQVNSVAFFPLIYNQNVRGIIMAMAYEPLDDTTLDRFDRFSVGITASLVKRHIEKENVSQRQFMERVLNNLPVDVAIFDDNRKYLYVNSSAIRDDQVRQWVINKDDYEYCQYRNVDPAIADERTTHYKKLSPQAPLSQWVETIYRHGKTFHFLRQSKGIFEGEKLTYIVGCGMDITQRIEAEKENLKLAEIVGNSRDAILSMDMDGAVTSWNDGACKLFGYGVEEILGTSFCRLHAMQSESQCFEWLERVKAGEQLTIVDGLGLHQDGSKVPVSISMFPVRNENGEIVGVSEIVRDISEIKATKRKVMEAVINGEEKERKRIAQELHDGLGQLLSGLKLNMVNIKDVVSKKIYDRIMQIADDSIREYRAVTHDLIPPALTEDGLAGALQHMCTILNNSNEIEMKLHVEGLKDELDQSIATVIFRVCQELVNNALKYANAGLIRIDLMMRNNILILAVQDNGIGFEVERIKMKEGIGLGNIKARVSLFNGEFDLITELGKGTRAVVKIPVT